MLFILKIEFLIYTIVKDVFDFTTSDGDLELIFKVCTNLLQNSQTFPLFFLYYILSWTPFAQKKFQLEHFTPNCLGDSLCIPARMRYQTFCYYQMCNSELETTPRPASSFLLNPPSADYLLTIVTKFPNVPRPWPRMLLFWNLPGLEKDACFQKCSQFLKTRKTQSWGKTFIFRVHPPFNSFKIKLVRPPYSSYNYSHVNVCSHRTWTR